VILRARAHMGFKAEGARLCAAPEEPIRLMLPYLTSQLAIMEALRWPLCAECRTAYWNAVEDRVRDE
jgi:hypothetical protein